MRHWLKEHPHLKTSLFIITEIRSCARHRSCNPDRHILRFFNSTILQSNHFCHFPIPAVAVLLDLRIPFEGGGD